jgi:hypothetical protein
MKHKRPLLQEKCRAGTKLLLNQEDHFKIKLTEVRAAKLLGGSSNLGSEKIVRHCDAESCRELTAVLHRARQVGLNKQS